MLRCMKCSVVVEADQGNKTAGVAAVQEETLCCLFCCANQGRWRDEEGVIGYSSKPASKLILQCLTGLSVCGAQTQQCCRMCNVSFCLSIILIMWCYCFERLQTGSNTEMRSCQSQPGCPLLLWCLLL